MKKTGKRILTVLAAGVFFLCTVVPAAAVNIDFHGKALTGVMSASNSYLLGGDENDRETFAAGKIRFRAEVGTDDNRAKLVYGFETGANNFGGSDWGYSGDSVDFENRFAYVQLNLPGMNDRVMGRAGLQKTGVNHWVWTETAAGLTLHGKSGINWTTGWFRGLEEGWDDDEFDDVAETDFYFVKGDVKPGDNITVGGFALYGEDFGAKGDIEFFEDPNPLAELNWNGIEDGADQYWVGLNGKIDGPVFASGDLIYQGGDAGPDGNLDVSAWLANLTVGARVSDNAKVSVHGLYVTGDDDPFDGDLDAFQSIDADVKVGQIFFKDGFAASMDRFVDDQFGATMPNGLRNNGLLTFAVDGEIQLDAKNSLRGAVRYLKTAEKDTLYYPGEDELGTEVDLWYAYKYNQNLTLMVECAYLFAGDLAEKMFDDDDNVYQVAAGMEFAF